MEEKQSAMAHYFSNLVPLKTIIFELFQKYDDEHVRLYLELQAR